MLTWVLALQRESRNVSLGMSRDHNAIGRVPLPKKRTTQPRKLPPRTHDDDNSTLLIRKGKNLLQATMSKPSFMTSRTATRNSQRISSAPHHAVERTLLGPRSRKHL